MQFNEPKISKKKSEKKSSFTSLLVEYNLVKSEKTARYVLAFVVATLLAAAGYLFINMDSGPSEFEPGETYTDIDINGNPVERTAPVE